MFEEMSYDLVRAQSVAETCFHLIFSDREWVFDSFMSVSCDSREFKSISPELGRNKLELRAISVIQN